MHTFVDIVLLVIALVAVGFLFLQRRRVRALRTEREEIEGEEHRMFDFLHGLGETLQTDSSTKNMNRTIVRGIVKVVAAKGGCLYLLDAKSGELVPAFQTPGCTPFIAVPNAIVAQSDTNTNALDSYLLLQSVPRDYGIFGQALNSGAPVRTDDLGATVQPDEDDTVQLQRGTAAMVAPLVYAGKEIGVIGVSEKIDRGGYTNNDFEVFQSIAEQSSFALGSALIHQEAHDKQQLDKEIQDASEIQKILLPFSAPNLEDFVVSAVNYPAKIVSGDYFDYIPVDDTHFGIVIGDVSGKGIPASLIMAMCRSVVRVKAAENLSPSSVLDSVNRTIFADIREDMFVTMAYLIVEKNSKCVTLVRAGHDPPILYRKADESLEMIKPPGLAVGIDSGDVFQRVTHDHSFDMESGDTLVLYTDGATEALDKNGVEFGLDPIEKAIKETAEQGAQAVIDRICNDLRAFLGDVPQNDDITLIALQKR